jgi:hypothetical protein
LFEGLQLPGIKASPDDRTRENVVWRPVITVPLHVIRPSPNFLVGRDDAVAAVGGEVGEGAEEEDEEEEEDDDDDDFEDLCFFSFLPADFRLEPSLKVRPLGKEVGGRKEREGCELAIGLMSLMALVAVRG